MPAKKKTVSKKVVAKKSTVSSSTVAPKKGLFVKRNIILGVVALVLIVAALLYVFRNMFIAATVNGQVVTRNELTSALDVKYGKNTLQGIVTREIIYQGMKQKGITVSDKEVNDEVKKIEDQLTKQGRTLTDALSAQQPPLSKQDLIDQIRIQKMIEKLYGKDIKVTDKEIDAYIEQNKDLIPEGQSESAVRASAKTQLTQQKLTAKFQTWLAELQKKAKVQYFVNF